MERKVQTRRSRNAKVIQEDLHLGGVLAGDARGAHQMKEPDRGNKCPLHIEDLVRPGGRGVVINPKVDPYSEVGLIAPREMPLEGREDFTSSL